MGISVGILGIPTHGVTQRATKSLSGLVLARSQVCRATPDFDPLSLFVRLRTTSRSASGFDALPRHLNQKSRSRAQRRYASAPTNLGNYLIRARQPGRKWGRTTVRRKVGHQPKAPKEPRFAGASSEAPACDWTHQEGEVLELSRGLWPGALSTATEF